MREVEGFELFEGLERGDPLETVFTEVQVLQFA